MQHKTPLDWRSLLNVIAGALLGLSYAAGAPQSPCQNQYCIDDGTCYSCLTNSNHYCSLSGSCPDKCTEGRCSLVAVALKYGAQPPVILSHACQSPPVTPVAFGGFHGIGLELLEQDDAPAGLMEATHGASDLLEHARLLVGGKPISGYRIGWIVTYSDNKPELMVGKPVALQVHLPPHALTVVPSQHIPRKIDMRPGVIAVGFFVAEVTFPGGDKWRADPKAIAEAAGVHGPR